MVFNARYGQKYGHMELRDSMWDSLTNLGVGPAIDVYKRQVLKIFEVYEINPLSVQRYTESKKPGGKNERSIQYFDKSRRVFFK